MFSVSFGKLQLSTDSGLWPVHFFTHDSEYCCSTS